MRIKRLIGFVLSFLIVILSGCTKTKVVNEKQEDKIAGKITVWTDKESTQTLKLSVESFKKLHNKADIVLEEVNKVDLNLKLKNSLESHNAIPDIIIAKDEDVQLLLKNYSEAFNETSGIIKKENYLKFKIDNIIRDGKLLGVPLNCKPAVLLYRTDILAAAGVNAEYIKTWGDLIFAGKAVLQNAKVNMLPLPLQEESSYRLFLNQLGASYFDKSGNPIVNSVEAVKSADMMKTLFTQGTIQNVDSKTNEVTLLTEGKIAAAITSLEEINEIIKTSPQMKGKLGVMKLPSFEEGGNEGISLGGDNMLLLNSSKDKALAFEFLRFTAEDRDNLKMLLGEVGMFPAYSNYYDEAWFSKKEPYFGDTKLWKLLSENAQDIYTTNYTENFQVIVPAIKDTIKTIVLNGSDSKSSLEGLENKLQIVK